jgi:hypothetical protein
VWSVSLHWLYRKKWNSKHKVPGNRKISSAVEPFGELLRALLEVAIQCHAIGTPGSKRYPHACDWFRLAAPELRLICLGEARSKTELVTDLRHFLAKLKDFQNPFPQNCFPNLSALVDDGISLAGQSNIFHNSYWRGLQKLKPNDGRSRGFMFSFSKWITELQTNPTWKNVSVTSTDDVVAQMGRGREAMTLKISIARSFAAQGFDDLI